MGTLKMNNLRVRFDGARLADLRSAGKGGLRIGQRLS
jgi:hypothetical protein